MLSRICIKCKDKSSCAKRFVNARKGEFVYCPDGSKILIDVEWIIA